MAKIPQPFSASSIMTGPVIPDAPASAFGHDGLQSIARGMQDLAQGLAVNKKTRDQIAEKQKQKDDELWLSQALSQYRRGLTDFEVDPKNANSPEVLPQYLNKAQLDADTLLEGAPSPEAAAAFEEKSRDTIDISYPRIASKGATNEMATDLDILANTWGQSLSSYHQQAGTDSEAAQSGLLENLASSTESIMTIYGDIDPEFTRKMIASRITDAAMALAEKSPDVAKKLVLDSPWLDEPTRQQLLSKVEKKNQDVSLVLKEDFTTAREKTIINAQKTGAAGTIPLKDYQAIFPGEEGIVIKRRDDSKIAAAVESHSFLGSVKGQIPNYKQDAATKLETKLDTEDRLQAFGSIVAPALARDQRQYEGDPTQWLYENNESIQSLQNELDALEGVDSGAGISAEDGGVLPSLGGEVDPAMTAGTREQLYNTILKYQGYPIEGGDPTKFMSRPPRDRHLLAKSQAETLAARINGGTVDTAVATINGLIEQYPTDELRAQVIQDLVNMPVDKIKPEFQIAFQNANEPWLPDFIGAIRSVGDLSSMEVMKANEVKTALSSNAMFDAFKKSTMGPQNQRSNEVSGYFDAIEVYAKTKVIKGGMTPKKAVEAAVEQVLGSTMTPIDIVTPAMNSFGRRDKGIFGRGANQQLWVPRIIDGEKLDEDSLQDLGRRMGVALAHIHPDDVDPAQFDTYSSLDEKSRRELIFKQIRHTGNYYPDPGGETYRVTVKNSNGEQVDLRHKSGKLFQLPIVKLPNYTTEVNNNGKKQTVKDFFPRDPAIHQKDVYAYPKTGYFWNFTQ